MGYEMDMSKEKDKKELLPEGQRTFQIVGCREAVSKSFGNAMFIFTFKDTVLGQEEEVYAVAVEGKRWFLKSVLKACGIKETKDGVYNWDIPDVMDKMVMGTVIHFPDTWINQKNETITTTKHKITDIVEVVPF